MLLGPPSVGEHVFCAVCNQRDDGHLLKSCRHDASLALISAVYMRKRTPFDCGSTLQGFDGVEDNLYRDAGFWRKLIDPAVQRRRIFRDSYVLVRPPTLYSGDRLSPDYLCEVT